MDVATLSEFLPALALAIALAASAGLRAWLPLLLADMAAHKVDQLVCLGDVATLGPSPSDVLHRLIREGWVPAQ